MRRATVDYGWLTTGQGISIHALLAESDAGLRAVQRFGAVISIHALLAESDGGPLRRSDRSSNFYPRSPCGERPCAGCSTTTRPHFYPRSPCGERLIKPFTGQLPGQISIHALLAESDLYPMRAFEPIGISIHALLAESDPLRQNALHGSVYFYPRSPCGERHFANIERKIDSVFLSTLSLRRATSARSAHKLLWAFLSTLSLRRATSSQGRTHQGRTISIHALLAESDGLQAGRVGCSARFLSTLSSRRATPYGWTSTPARSHFYPRSPCGERRRCHLSA